MCDIDGCILNSRNTVAIGSGVLDFLFFIFRQAWNYARGAFLMILYYRDTIVSDDGFYDF